MRTPAKELGRYQHTVELPGSNWSMHQGSYVSGTFLDGSYRGRVTFASDDDALVEVISHTGNSPYKTSENIYFLFNNSK